MPVLAIAAVAAGAAVATGVIAASTMAMIGLATSVVGKITKSKELSQIGAGMSLGAGVASSVFGTSAAAGTAEAATANIGSVAESTPGIDATASIVDSSSAAGGIADASNGVGQTAGMLDVSSNAAQGTDLTSAANTAAEGSTAAPRGLLSQSMSQPLSATPQSSLAADANSITGGVGQTIGAGSAILPPAATDSGSIASWWAKQTEPVKSRILQMGAQAAGGMFEGWTAEQKLALEREKMNLEKQRYDTSMSNSSSQPTVRFKPNMPANYGLLTATKRG